MPLRREATLTASPVTAWVPFPRVHVRGNHQAGVDAAVHGERSADPTLVLRAQSLDQVMDLHGGTDGTNRIILMSLRDSEKSQNPVPQQTINKTFVFRNNAFYPGKDLPGDFLHLLRIEPLGQGCVASKIRKEDCDVFAFRFRSGVLLGSRRVRLDLVPTFQAEVCPFRKLSLAPGTNHITPQTKNPTSRLRSRVILIPPYSCLPTVVVAKLEDGLLGYFGLRLN